jgi:hypothetical protein
LYAVCYQRFAPSGDLKSTPPYDFIELNRSLITGLSASLTARPTCCVDSKVVSKPVVGVMELLVVGLLVGAAGNAVIAKLKSGCAFRSCAI